MKGEEFLQEHWDSACDNMPQDYLDAVMAQIDAIQPARCIFDIYDPKNIWDMKHIADIARDFALYSPREGQPDWCERRITPWFEEGLLRQNEIRAYWAQKKNRAQKESQHGVRRNQHVESQLSRASD